VKGIRVIWEDKPGLYGSRYIGAIIDGQSENRPGPVTFKVKRERLIHEASNED